MTALAPTDHKPPAKPEPDNRPPTGRTKRAIDLMVHEGLTDNEAAVQVGITVTAIRLAIQRRGVRRYLQEQREVSRERICARNIHRLAEIRDAADNMPALQAIRTLEQMSEEAAEKRPAAPFSGLVVQIVTSAPSEIKDITPVTRSLPMSEPGEEGK